MGTRKQAIIRRMFSMAAPMSRASEACGAAVSAGTDRRAVSGTAGAAALLNY
jgi:hypothetical protein